MNLPAKGHDVLKAHTRHDDKERFKATTVGAGSRLDSVILIGMLCLIVFTALAFGAVEAWSIFTFELLVIGLIFLWGMRVFFNKKLALKIPLIALPVILLFITGVLQSFAVTDAHGGVQSLSKDVEATRWATTIIFFLLICILLTSTVLVEGKWINRIAGFLVIYGLALAVFALIQYLSWDGRIYWVRPTLQNAFGPFVNRNHYAGYMEMLIPIPAAMIFSRDIRSELRLFYCFAVLVMSISLVMSASRGGMVSLAAGLSFVIIIAIQRLQNRVLHRYKSPGENFTLENPSRKKNFLIYVPLALAFILVLLAGLLWLGPEPVLNRISDTVQGVNQENVQSKYLSREWLWRDSLTIFLAHPVLGAGLGSFETVYPQYGHSDGMTVVPQAHNDYLQILADVGILGGVALIGFLIFFFRTFVKSLRIKDSKLAAVSLGVGGGVFAMLIHSFFDFNLQIPANALLFLFLVSVLSCISEFSLDKNSVTAPQKDFH
jgi:O-antigen ligase